MEDSDTIKQAMEELNQKVTALGNKVNSVEKEMRNSKPRENINVRVVDTKDGKKIVVEHSVERWYSPKYFNKLLNSTSDSGSESQGKSVKNDLEPGDSLF